MKSQYLGLRTNSQLHEFMWNEVPNGCIVAARCQPKFGEEEIVDDLCAGANQGIIGQCWKGKSSVVRKLIKSIVRENWDDVINNDRKMFFCVALYWGKSKIEEYLEAINWDQKALSGGIPGYPASHGCYDSAD